IGLGAAYMLWLYWKTMLGNLDNPNNMNLSDLNMREQWTLIPIIVLIVWIGLYPKPFLNTMHASVDNVVQRVNPGYVPTMGTFIAAPVREIPSLGELPPGHMPVDMVHQQVIETVTDRKAEGL
ncbi:MAG: hypothetical protein AAB275_08330, partial [Deltaproteobacteria bacterium]